MGWKEVSSRKEVPSQKEYAHASELLVHWDHFLFELDFLWQGTHKRELRILLLISFCKVDMNVGMARQNHQHSKNG